MKTIIAGSRGITDLSVVIQAVEASGFKISQVVSGTAKGVDRLGEIWADINEVPIAPFPADWEQFGRGAGFKRNKQMAEYADALIAVWDGSSKGTVNMINWAAQLNLKVYVHTI